MGEVTGISWTDATWNPTVGCTRVSEGCDHCYAFALHDGRHIAWKRGRMPDAPAQYHWPFSQVQLLNNRIDSPRRWKKPRRVFVNSMSDLFHEDVPSHFIASVFRTMRATPQHTYQVLTKRPERMKAWIDANNEITVPVLPNVWLGVSVENQQRADERIPVLLRAPAAVRFISAEPLLEPVSLARWLGCADPTCDCKPWLDWVIVGGESGPHHRPLDLPWVREIRDECRAAGVAYFGKQNSGARPGIPLPDDLGDQEYPR